ncbi:MAG TPA: sigma-54 dependent transcriptional regulator [Thermoanaerobaculia bacterium]|nr:sigma-54 dependent transcriptional regulator [Thermoanaerobaculia bacterium]
MGKRTVLVVDDEAAIRTAVRKFLSSHGFEVSEAMSCQGALERARTLNPDAIILDYSLPDGTALDVLPQLREAGSTAATLVLTAHGSIDIAVAAVREGADHFLTKPIELPALLVILEREIENQRNRRNTKAVKAQTSSRLPDPFTGTSEVIRRLAAEAERVTRGEHPVLLQGETGSGKGVLARWLHLNGPRADEPFLDLNCAGLSREFLETELFGHERGAFTGAVEAKQGLLEVADHGTLFLDEIGDVDLQVQPKLLKVLEEQRFRRLGEVRDRQVNVRLLAATHHDLRQLVDEKKFRLDLFFRISTIVLRLPPLRERKEDLPLLSQRMLEALAPKSGHVPRLSDDAMAALMSYAWPGNLRELRNVLERAVFFAGSETIRREDLALQFSSREDAPASDEIVSLVEAEARYIRRVLLLEQGSVERAAKKLGVPRNTLYYKLKKLGIALG